MLLRLENARDLAPESPGIRGLVVAGRPVALLGEPGDAHRVSDVMAAGTWYVWNGEQAVSGASESSTS